MYLYLASATIASKSVPKVSSEKVALKRVDHGHEFFVRLRFDFVHFAQLHCMEEGRVYALLRAERDRNVTDKVRDRRIF